MQRSRIGPYEVLAKLGEGGMGEVYRARDGKLNRDVAIKVLPEAFALDPDRLARFEREAQTLAALNHPNIAHIHGLEEANGARALVMELVEGEDLSAVIARGPLSLSDALPIARQIAGALDAAHDAGIIHRDLKPANIRIRPDGTVKVLDFGLAKAIEPAAGSDPLGLAQSPTLTSPVMTEVGVILGTAAYMSPEQARGRVVDRRADVWAFGVILHEMLTGERLFAAESVGDSIAAVLTREPDWRRVPALVKPLLRACLEKDSRKRLRSFGDGLLLLDLAPAPAEQAQRRSLLPWVAGALVIGAIAAAAVLSEGFRTESPRAPLAFQEPAPAGTRLLGAPLVSPDGGSLALLARDASGVTRIWTRAFSDAKARPLDGSDGASLMFWSPDSAELAFAAGDELRRIPRNGGVAKRVAAGTARSGVWTPVGEIVIATRAGLFRVPADGGTPRQLLAGRAGSFLDLALLSSGRHLLFRQFGVAAGLYVLDLDTGDATRLDWAAAATLRGGVVSYAAPDIVLYAENQGLVGRRLDPSNRSMVGEAFSVVEAIRHFAGSASGALTYVPTAPVATRMTWRDRQGRPAGTFGPEGDYREVYISRGGQWLMYVAADPAGNLDLWIQDPRAPAANRLTSDPDVDHLAAFSPDGSEIVWEGHRAGGLTLFRQRSNGSGGIQTARVWNRGGGPSDWSPDGRFVLNASQETGTGEDIWVVPMRDKTEPFALIASEFDEMDGKISPDGRWLAYASTASGRPEIYLQRLDGWRLVGGPLRVSSGGGEQPAWRSDGSELFYRANDALAVVPISGDAERPAGVPRVLFSLAATTGGFAVAADGQRILVIQGDRESADSAVVVMDWSDTLKKR